MKSLIYLSLLTFFALPLFSDVVFAGVWTQVGPHTIKFDGVIENGEFERFSIAFTDKIDEIVVNSEGGIVKEGLKIGLAISQRPVKIIVTGLCISSCANYIFVAGTSREIKNGIVGFHGNSTACFQKKYMANKEQYFSEVRKEFLEYDSTLSESHIQSLINSSILSTESESKQESIMLSKAGVSQDLFDRTCTLDKGMNDGKEYTYLLPSKQTFIKYGFKNIIGDQDKNIAATFPAPVIID